MGMDEKWARHVVLAQAIETADTRGTLLSEVERSEADQQIRAQAAAAGAGPKKGPELAHLLHQRARLVLAAVEKRSTALAALQAPRPWVRWVAWAAPAIAFILGVLTDRVANPHRVDLLSLPLLAIVLWNLGVYALLAASYAVARPRWQRPLLPSLREAIDGLREWRRRSGKVHAEVAARFYARWHVLTAALSAQRGRRVLHLCAALWGAGVAVSLFTRGLVVQYQVGWESTFLGEAQVHAILSVLFMPVVALFSHAPFTVDEVARLRFGAGDGAIGGAVVGAVVGAAAGARWVTLYASLLLLVVVVPRLVLAALAFGRERVLAREVAIDLAEPYFQRLIAALCPARVQLCVYADRHEDRAALLRVLLRDAEEGEGAIRIAIGTPGGDMLCIAEMPDAPEISAGASARWLAARDGSPAHASWLHKAAGAVRRRWNTQSAAQATAADAQTVRAAREDSDVMVLVARSAGELQATTAWLQWLGKPVLVVLHLPGGAPAQAQEILAQCRQQARDAGLAAQVVFFDAFARCWIQERVLLDAIGRNLGEAKREGYARLCSAWHARHLKRLQSAMAALAGHLVFAARQREEVHSPPVSLKLLASAAKRQSSEHARKVAMVAVVERLQRSEVDATSRLLALYGGDAAAAGALTHRLEEKFVVQQAVSTPQAGMAGAATGAAMGASVDLLVGGLTLGAAAALGALVGGSAAFVAAAWKNKDTAGGVTTVQLSDEMLQAMLEAGLLRYLAISANDGAGVDLGVAEPQLFWKSAVVAAVETDRESLKTLWAQARAAHAPEPANRLAQTLEAMVLKLLRDFYPAPRAP